MPFLYPLAVGGVDRICSEYCRLFCVCVSEIGFVPGYVQQDGYAQYSAIYLIPLIELLSYLPIADLSRLRLDL